IVNEADLLAALESGQVAGAAIDVWSEEPPQSETLRRLIQHPRVVVTPHLGANSSEAQVNVAVDVARQLVAFRDGELVEHAVNIQRVGEASGYKSVLRVTTQTRHGQKIIAGTVFDSQPRVVRLRDFDVEFVPEGYILMLSYEDRPGMVGRIGSTLGRQNVNIASMHVGRKSKRGRAIVVL